MVNECKTEKRYWSAEDCPPWCCGDHPLDDHPEDAVHATELSPIPVVAGSRGNQSAARSSYFDVARLQHVSGGEEWVFVGDGESGWVITKESAGRVLRALARVLEP